MQQCPFCGTEREENSPCPNCGMKPEQSQDDSLFRPPEGGEKAAQEVPPEFEVEKLLRWEPSPEIPAPEVSETSGEKENEEPAAEEMEETEEAPQRIQRHWKRWQKFTAAGVAAVIVVSAVVGKLWLQPQALPPEPAVFVMDQDLMAFPKEGKSQQIGYYQDGVEDSLTISPDHENLAWVENGTLKIWQAEEETSAFSQKSVCDPQFSKDGKFLYYLGDEGEESVLYQMEIDSKEERAVGPVGEGFYWENSSLLMLKEDDCFDIYDVNTLKKMGSLDIYGTVVSLSENQVYYVENMEDVKAGMQLCCWQDGKKEVLLKNISQYYENGDGSAYIECYPEGVEPVSVADLVYNDMGTQGEELLEQLKEETFFPPNRNLYYFTGNALRFMGDNLEISLLPNNGLRFVGENLNLSSSAKAGENTVLISSSEYFSVEETKGTFALSDMDTLLSLFPDLNFTFYLGNQWPKKNSTNFLAVEEKSFPLPEDAPTKSIGFRLMGDWVCLYQLADDEIPDSKLWLGKLEGNRVTSQASYFVPETGVSDYMVTAGGNLYYWEGPYTATLYVNGMEISNKVVPESIQCTSDGGVYFLEGAYSDNLALCRVKGGEREVLAQPVESFTAYSRDYALCLQKREDNLYDLLACKDGEDLTLVAQQVERLLPSLLEPLVSGKKTGEWQ